MTLTKKFGAGLLGSGVTNRELSNAGSTGMGFHCADVVASSERCASTVVARVETLGALCVTAAVDVGTVGRGVVTPGAVSLARTAGCD